MHFCTPCSIFSLFQAIHRNIYDFFPWNVDSCQVLLERLSPWYLGAWFLSLAIYRSPCHCYSSRAIIGIRNTCPARQNLGSVTISDNFLEPALDWSSSFVTRSLYVTSRIFLRYRWWKTFNSWTILAAIFHVPQA